VASLPLPLLMLVICLGFVASSSVSAVLLWDRTPYVRRRRGVGRRGYNICKARRSGSDISPLCTNSSECSLHQHQYPVRRYPVYTLHFSLPCIAHYANVNMEMLGRACTDLQPGDGMEDRSSELLPIPELLY